MGLIGLLIAIWLIYALRSIYKELTRANASLERILALMGETSGYERGVLTKLRCCIICSLSLSIWKTFERI